AYYCSAWDDSLSGPLF
nr:immunoglobulin light chain junction region [Macaca mulatta]MOW68138.1 immunoglobulin light chain junction region [Macaca mulatta]